MELLREYWEVRAQSCISVPGIPGIRPERVTVLASLKVVDLSIGGDVIQSLSLKHSFFFFSKGVYIERIPLYVE